MKTKKISVELPENLYNDLQEIAGASSWKFEDVILQTIRIGMPPSLNKVPPAFHDELLALNKLNDRGLFQVIENDSTAQDDQDEDHRRANFDALRRMYALSLLKWRGHPIPSPYESLPG